MGNRIFGVTEQFWSTRTAEFKLYWGLGSKAVSLLLGFFIMTKTGFAWLDNTVALLTGSIAILITSGQRDYSKYPRRLRRKITRYSVGVTLRGVTILGAGIFLAVLAPLVAGVTQSLPSFSRDSASPSIDALTRIYSGMDVSAFQNVLLLVVYAVVAFALFKGSINAFRGMQIEELIYRAPRRGLIKYLVRREQIVSDVPTLLQFELTVLMLSVMFSSGVVMLCQMILSAHLGK